MGSYRPGIFQYHGEHGGIYVLYVDVVLQCRPEAPQWFLEGVFQGDYMLHSQINKINFQAI